MTKEKNPLIWGAVTGIICAAIMTASQFFGTSGPDNRLLQTPVSAAGVGFFFGWSIANIKNWLARR